jgi:hypothetical protein
MRRPEKQPVFRGDLLLRQKKTAFPAQQPDAFVLD